MISCKICNRQITNHSALSKHISHYHKMTTEEYYLKYINTQIGYCRTCSRPTKFISIPAGYKTHCNMNCACNDPEVLAKINTPESRRKKSISAKKISKESINHRIETTKKSLLSKYGVDNSAKRPEVTEKMKTSITNRNNKFSIENNCTTRQELINLYGRGWLSLDVPYLYNKRTAFVPNSFISIIEKYSNNHSIAENKLYEYITNIYSGTVLRNYQKAVDIVFGRCELDIYIPDLHLAIEYNSNYYHCLDSTKDEYYHYNKSKACWLSGIRLIHIYEFEDFDTQLTLLKELIVNQNDLFDLSNNNKYFSFDDHVPEIIHENPVIYGA